MAAFASMRLLRQSPVYASSRSVTYVGGEGVCVWGGGGGHGCVVLRACAIAGGGLCHNAVVEAVPGHTGVHILKVCDLRQGSDGGRG